mmetsp:Transcript_25799/g.42143  ORF Transcript_25799/g.42143 Transcript_25799/m.42143 type:complete len:238 (+) Transcript_25799:377-1090(+)
MLQLILVLVVGRRRHIRVEIVWQCKHGIVDSVSRHKAKQNRQVLHVEWIRLQLKLFAKCDIALELGAKPFNAREVLFAIQDVDVTLTEFAPLLVLRLTKWSLFRDQRMRLPFAAMHLNHILKHHRRLPRWLPCRQQLWLLVLLRILGGVVQRLIILLCRNPIELQIKFGAKRFFALINVDAMNSERSKHFLVMILVGHKIQLFGETVRECNLAQFSIARCLPVLIHVINIFLHNRFF